MSVQPSDTTHTSHAPHRSIHPALGIAMVAAPVLHVIAGVISPALKSKEAAQLSVVAAHSTRWYWYTLLLVVGSIVVVPASVGLLQLGRARMRRVGTVGGVLVTLGFLGSLVDCAGQFWTWQMVAPGADRQQMAALLTRVDGATGTDLFFAVTGIGLLIGSVLLAVALVRNRSVPSWAAIVLTAAVFVNIIAFSASSVAGVAASFVLLLLGMGWIGVTSLRGGRLERVAVHASQPAMA